MSVKEEYEALKNQATELQKEIAEKERTLKGLKKQCIGFNRKKNELSKRTSRLAKKILVMYKNYIFLKKREIQKAEEELEKLREDLEDVQIRIDSLEDDPSEYIEEQAKIMAQDLKEYVDEFEFDFGSAIISKITIGPEMIFDKNISSGLYVPNGNVTISIDEISLVTSEQPYPFSEPMYRLKKNSWNSISVQYTDWFKDFYLQLFYKELRTKIEEAFKDHPNFSVKFTDETHFNIELR